MNRESCTQPSPRFVFRFDAALAQQEYVPLELRPTPSVTARIIHDVGDVILLIQPFGLDVDIPDPANGAFIRSPTQRS